MKLPLFVCIGFKTDDGKYIIKLIHNISKFETDSWFGHETQYSFSAGIDRNFVQDNVDTMSIINDPKDGPTLHVKTDTVND